MKRLFLLGLCCAALGTACAQSTPSPAPNIAPSAAPSSLAPASAAAPTLIHPSATPAATQAGIFKKVQGRVLVIAADQKTQRSVQSGDSLALGERILTGKKAGASVTLSDGTELMLGERSSVALPQWMYDSTTQEGHLLLDFLGGQLRVTSGLIAKTHPANMKVKTPDAVIGVRGTDFVLEAAHVDQ